MPQFIVNRNQQSNGDHEVHNLSTGCSHMPEQQNRIDLGFHISCSGAVSEARRQYPGRRINGCYYCCNPCHTS